ncbi:SCO1860 family LAETG-anchored protein [Streptacidiphilus monticola]|uniref:SCO1860 family LAETG-anchored protein n=1 Tax=Streptacidiphilus monticola TaxID=2161674 RepID=A0ABW1G1A9_9ACTN
MSRMYRFAMPACAFASAALLGMAQPAFATNGGGAPVGTASATTAEVGLDVKLLNAVDVPVEATLNRIDSPVSKGGSLLTVNVDGLHHGSPLSLLRADAGRTWATSDSHGSHAGVELVKADAHLPSLLLASLLQADLVKATADCPAGGRPTAAAEVAGHVKVLGIGVQLKVGGPTVVDVPLVGKVSLELSRTTVTDDSAAAAALRLSVEVNPLNIDVAKITGEVTLAQASCTKPAGQQGGGGGNGGGGNGGGSSASASPSASHSTPAGGGSNGGGGTGGCGCSTSPSATASGTRAGGPSASASGSVSATATGGGAGSGGGDNEGSGTGAGLATTGASSSTPLIAGGAVVAVGAGVGALTLARRRRAKHG